MSKSKHSQVEVEGEGAYGRSFEALPYLTPIAQPFLACPADKLGGRAPRVKRSLIRSVGPEERLPQGEIPPRRPMHGRSDQRVALFSVLPPPCQKKVMLRCSCYFALDNSMCITTRTVRCGGVVYLTQELSGRLECGDRSAAVGGGGASSACIAI